MNVLGPQQQDMQDVWAPLAALNHFLTTQVIFLPKVLYTEWCVNGPAGGEQEWKLSRLGMWQRRAITSKDPARLLSLCTVFWCSGKSVGPRLTYLRGWVHEVTMGEKPCPVIVGGRMRLKCHK